MGEEEDPSMFVSTFIVNSNRQSQSKKLMTDMVPIDTAALDCCGYPYRCTLEGLMKIKTLRGGFGGWIVLMFLLEILEEISQL